VDIEITPQPTEEERQAILRALELEREEADEPTPWRRAARSDVAEPAVFENRGSDPGVTKVQRSIHRRIA
jgi:hypothetical protein